MAQVQLTVGIILAILGVVLIAIATTISGVISTRFAAGDIKTRLLVTTAFSGITAILAIITALIGIFFARAKSAGTSNYKGLGIGFLIAVILVLLFYIVVIAVTLSVRAEAVITGDNKTALTASLILIAFGFVSIAISAIVFFTITKGKGKADALSALKFSKSA